MRRQAIEMTYNVIEAFGLEIIHERTVLLWFQNFRNGEESFQEKEHRGRPSEIDKDQLTAKIETDP